MMDAAKTRAKDKINEVNSSLTKLVQMYVLSRRVKLGNNFICVLSKFEPLGKGNY